MKMTLDKGKTPFPSHIAIIMDGNRRWAEQHGLPKSAGHRAGVESLRTTIEYLGKREIPFLTLFSFSTENWKRSEEEVQGLLMLLEQVLGKETGELHKRDVQIRHLGRLEGLPPNVREVIKRSNELTQDNSRMVVSFAFNYGGRGEILDAVKRIVEDKIPISAIDERVFSERLYTSGLPDIDLLIRTGGETRLSNFLIWQTVYSEIYFTDVLWPDFNVEELDKALNFYSQKQRRFGK